MINAIIDALAEYGVKDINMPATPMKVWQAIHSGKAAYVCISRDNQKNGRPENTAPRYHRRQITVTRGRLQARFGHNFSIHEVILVSRLFFAGCGSAGSVNKFCFISQGTRDDFRLK